MNYKSGGGPTEETLKQEIELHLRWRLEGEGGWLSEYPPVAPLASLLWEKSTSVLWVRDNKLDLSLYVLVCLEPYIWASLHDYGHIYTTLCWFDIFIDAYYYPLCYTCSNRSSMLGRERGNMCIRWSRWNRVVVNNRIVIEYLGVVMVFTFLCLPC